jgi:hypothetical protein
MVGVFPKKWAARFHERPNQHIVQNCLIQFIFLLVSESCLIALNHYKNKNAHTFSGVRACFGHTSSVSPLSYLFYPLIIISSARSCISYVYILMPCALYMFRCTSP